MTESSSQSEEIFLVGYTDRLSGRPGDQIQFHTSCQENTPISARLVRSICADPNPKGPGILEEDAAKWFERREFMGRHQPISVGSFAVTTGPILSEYLRSKDYEDKPSISVDIWVFCTLQKAKSSKLQCIWFWGETFGLYMHEDGRLQVLVGCKSLGKASATTTCISTTPVPLRQWRHCVVKVDFVKRQLKLSIYDKKHTGVSEDNFADILPADFVPSGPFGLATNGTFNGKLEFPRITDAKGKILVSWDTSENMSGWMIPCNSEVLSGNDIFPLRICHHPTRGVQGHLWDGTEMCWKHKPSHYAALHFHEDDCYDFQWSPDFVWTIPEGMPSGVYLVHLQATDARGSVHNESLPIFVCPPMLQDDALSNTSTSARKASLCLLVSTFTYVMYGNHARSDYDDSAFAGRLENWNGMYPHNAIKYPQYRQSTYNFHTDGSGIHYASHRRPLLTLRPGYVSLAHTDCSGLRHFPADSHLIAYLHHQGIAYDVVTDHELHADGVKSLRGYSTVMTGTHPEYHTLASRQALQDFRDILCGNLIYLGGNGFYWRIAAAKPESSTPQAAPSTSKSVDADGDSERGSDCHLLEIRRAEDGVRTWASEPGEYYHPIDHHSEEGCTYGGLWRRNGRPPQELVGIGFASQGSFSGIPYRRTNESKTDSSLAWIFDGLPNEVEFGNFGLSGGGAAGFELDRIDRRLDGMSNVPITILAQAFGKSPSFILVPEEVLTTYSNLSGTTEEEARRCDMVYFKTPEGAKVFSVGSITFCGSLPWNNFDNSIAKLLSNVLKHFVSEFN